VTQSVELLLDPVSEAVVRDEWLALRDAGLPTEQRAQTGTSHRPHITLFAGPEILPEVDRALSRALSDLDLECQLGALMLFGPHRDRFVLVHQVVPTTGMLEVQSSVARLCGADGSSNFAPGRWSPHVTVARRLPREQVPDVLSVLDGAVAVGHPVQVTSCRRWDGAAKTTWLL